MSVTFEEFDDARKLAVIDGADVIFCDYDSRICFGKQLPNEEFRQTGHIDRNGHYFCDI